MCNSLLGIPLESVAKLAGSVLPCIKDQPVTAAARARVRDRGRIRVRARAWMCTGVAYREKWIRDQRLKKGKERSPINKQGGCNFVLKLAELKLPEKRQEASKANSASSRKHWELHFRLRMHLAVIVLDFYPDLASIADLTRLDSPRAKKVSQ